MMDWTDRHCRRFHRLLAPSALLYTEMVTTGAVLHGRADRFLAFAPEESPVALQLGGAEPDDLARAAALAAGYGYAEVNLNCGCPSPRVQKGCFGAALMAEPDRVAACVAAMRAATPLPVTVKCRIAIDDEDPEAFLDRFVDAVAEAGCGTFVVHARKAWLRGLSPKENRTVPPLDYDRVARLKARRPDLEIILNGGIVAPEAAAREAARFDGVMVGREAYQNPLSLPRFAATLEGRSAIEPDPFDLIERMAGYAEVEGRKGVPVKAVLRHLLGLANGRPGARAFRRDLAAAMAAPDAGGDVLRRAARHLDPLASDPRSCREAKAALP
ncbi:MAG: tRNA dihydrouridine(20/20a) synthase DusA [Geminicoccaceae bacterium]|nr:tRNA dihydrouridine(20/20a) synthase DusA [Geminicoccaceae bacterium]